MGSSDYLYYPESDAYANAFRGYFQLADGYECGEPLDVSYLRDLHYAIIERDWHSGHRDIDIIAIDGDELVFVEVKTRRNRITGDPLDSIDEMKMRNLRQAINNYVKSHQVSRSYRLDFITVVGTEFELPEIEHIKRVNL